MKFQSNDKTFIIPVKAADINQQPNAIKWTDVTEKQAREWVHHKDHGSRYSNDSRYVFWTTHGKKKGFFFRCGTARAAVLQLFYDSKIIFSQENDYILVESVTL